MIHPIVAVVAGLVVLAAAPGTPGQPPGQAGGAARPAEQDVPRARVPRTGTGRIRGRVVTPSGSPVRRAEAQLISDDVFRRASTDDNGMFEFAGLPSGAYTLSAQKPGYVSTEHGQMHPFEPGEPVALADRQVLDQADIIMPRGAAVVGRVVDEFGDPLPGVSVAVSRRYWMEGHDQLRRVGEPTQTDDLGHYRLQGLPPGDYYVRAAMPIDGRKDERYAATPSSGGPTASAPPTGYAPAFYSGAGPSAQAAKVTVGPMQVVSGVDFRFAPVRLATVSGTVVMADGRPLADGMVLVEPHGGFTGLGEATVMGGVVSGGAFTVRHVPPGEYTLLVTNAFAAGPGVSSDPASRRSSPALEWGTASVAVAGVDRPGLAVTMRTGARALGRIVFEGDPPPPASELRVGSVDRAVTTAPVACTRGTGGLPTADRTFEVTDLFDRSLFCVAGLPPGWFTKAVRLNGKDVTDSGIEFNGPPMVSGIEIVVSSRQTDVSGRVTGVDGQAARDGGVIVFADDPQKWRAPSGRWISGVRPGGDGRFRVSGLPAGGYFAAAVTDIPMDEWRNPELLERLQRTAQRVSLVEGQRRTLDLTIQPVR